MYGNLALGLFIITVIVLFSKDWHNIYKKIASYRGLRLVLPVLLASALWLKFDFFIDAIVIRIHIVILQASLALSRYFPNPRVGHFFASTLILVALPTIISALGYLWNKYNPFHRIGFIGKLNVFVWIFATLILISDLSLQ